MALVKFGAGISEMRGKEGGVIYSRNAYGSYIKTKISPVNPQTAKQQAQRTLMGNLSQSWSTLSSAVKGDWDNLGAQVTRVNRFGDNMSYTGFSLFMKLNRNLVLAGSAAITAPPVPPTIPVLSLTAMTAAVTVNELNLTFTPTPVPTGFKVFAYLTPNILTGRRFVKNYYRLIKKIAAAQTSPQQIRVDWETYFGSVLVQGAALFAKIKLVDTVTGFEGVSSNLSCVVSA